MTSSALPRADLEWHPACVAGTGTPFDCTITANFRTYDPVNFGDMPIIGARVDLVPTSGTTYHGQTDQFGDLYALGSQNVKIVVPNADASIDYHFEVLGPVANPSQDLTHMTYPVGSTTKYFTTPKWSTDGWQEPELHWGTFKLSVPAFPPSKFTVGCRMQVYTMRYLTARQGEGFFPENIKLNMIRTTTSNSFTNALTIDQDSKISAVFFNVKPGDKVRIEGQLDTDAIALPDNISSISGSLKVNGQLRDGAPGEYFGFDALSCVDQIQLYKLQDFSPTRLPPHVVKGLLLYDVAKLDQNVDCHYNELSTDMKFGICFNWFVEFVAARNIFIRTMNKLLTKCTKITWAGMPNLTLTIDDGYGGAATSDSQHQKFGLGDILTGRVDACAHETAHAFAYQYFIPGNPDALQYFPQTTNGHYGSSYSNEFFAFQEGFAEIITWLFLEPSRRYGQNLADWHNLFSYQSPMPGPKGVQFGCPASPTTLMLDANLEPNAGIVIEFAFSAALASLWSDIIWPAVAAPAGEFDYIQDQFSNGAAPELGLNTWLVNTDLQQKFATFIVDAIAAAARVDGRMSTRRIVDEIQQRASQNGSAIPWASIDTRFARFRVSNAFYISTVKLGTGNLKLIVRSSDTSFAYGTSDLSQFVFHRNAVSTLTLGGIRIPSTGLVAKLVSGTTEVAATVAVQSDYAATAAFTIPTTAANGVYDLKFDDGNAGIQLLPAAVKVQP